MATIVAMAPPMPARTATPPPHLTINTSVRGTPAAVPNKHLPVCTPGPRRVPDASIALSPGRDTILQPSILYPPDHFNKILNEPPVYTIDARTVFQALAYMASQPLPDPRLVFPWLHGLHAENQLQLSYFVSRRKSLRKVPKCLRTVTVVKAGGDLSHSKLKGAIAPEELLLPQCATEDAAFIDIDPKDGFCVRNFQIQACKLGTVSDIIVYADHTARRDEVLDLARQISNAQLMWRSKMMAAGNDLPQFNTFVVSDHFSVFEKHFKEIVAIDSKACMTGHVVDFFYWERVEMCTMSRASEISKNVFLGPTPDPLLAPWGVDAPAFDIHIECSDVGHLPDSKYLREMRSYLDNSKHQPLHMEFTSSGSILPPTWSQVEVDSLMEMCRWIYEIANADNLDTAPIRKDSVGDMLMFNKGLRPQKVLLHCADGYTETSLLALAYFMYAEGVPVHEAWARLHREKGRNFFAYPSDVSLLRAIQPRILQESPRYDGDFGSISSINEPAWLPKIDGSLPSRILPYMYLGNLNHANNPLLLRELGITRILSVGEPVSWSKDTVEEWGEENLLFIDRVQDNGVDALTDEFQRCLSFIEQGKLDNTATLVHCRVGVSRSATICIAEVMNELGLSFPRAYCFVRARRLNVIIQPHLRFTYELLKWEEYQQQKRNEPLCRELEWASVSREIALMNKPYSRQS